jgi:hypothetical protein
MQQKRVIGNSYPIIIETQHDKNGIKWGLFTSGILGNCEDFWIMRNDGTKWIEPKFTMIELSVVWDGLSGRGFEINLRKINEHWIVIKTEETWRS